MNKSNKKRTVPPLLSKVLTADVYMTDQFVKSMEKILMFKQLQTHYKLLEISCHGLLWLPCWLGFIWILSNKSLYQMQVNFFIGLVLDLTVVAVIKAITRRRRPTKSTDIGPDKFSFPSGHASRALFIISFFLNIWPVNFIFIPPLLCWGICICISRILMRRHHLLDIVVGAILGIIESHFIRFIYLQEKTCVDIIWWLTDEKLDGGEYHV